MDSRCLWQFFGTSECVALCIPQLTLIHLNTTLVLFSEGLAGITCQKITLIELLKCFDFRGLFVVILRILW